VTAQLQHHLNFKFLAHREQIANALTNALDCYAYSATDLCDEHEFQAMTFDSARGRTAEPEERQAEFAFLCRKLWQQVTFGVHWPFGAHDLPVGFAVKVSDCYSVLVLPDLSLQVTVSGEHCLNQNWATTCENLTHFSGIVVHDYQPRRGQEFGEDHWTFVVPFGEWSA
jgi:hypothetical protein